ncbi:MAG: HD domain-containing protein [Deltaproteobacteria bacterium]|nr:HD domain-containing protein [Deltaproteobacteria bacterium]
MSNLVLEAAYFAARKHRDQKRKGVDASPYINHPLEVASLLARVGGVDDQETLAAALLHDTLEDTETTVAELVELFGKGVSGMVEEVTDDKKLPKEERKEEQLKRASTLSPGAALVKLGDKISNVRDVTEHPPEDWDAERRLKYVDWASGVVGNLPVGTNAALEEHFEKIAAEARRVIA